MGIQRQKFGVPGMNDVENRYKKVEDLRQRAVKRR